MSNAQPPAMFRISGDKVTGTTTPEDAQNFKDEIDYLFYFICRIGDELGMKSVDYGIFREKETRIGFRYNRMNDVPTTDINGIITSSPTTIEAILTDLK